MYGSLHDFQAKKWKAQHIQGHGNVILVTCPLLQKGMTNSSDIAQRNHNEEESVTMGRANALGLWDQLPEDLKLQKYLLVFLPGMNLCNKPFQGTNFNGVVGVDIDYRVSSPRSLTGWVTRNTATTTPQKILSTIMSQLLCGSWSMLTHFNQLTDRKRRRLMTTSWMTLTTSLISTLRITASRDNLFWLFCMQLVKVKSNKIVILLFVYFSFRRRNYFKGSWCCVSQATSHCIFFSSETFFTGRFANGFGIISQFVSREDRENNQGRPACY